MRCFSVASEVLLLGFFENLVSEEICGRFGFVATDELGHIDLLGLRSDDVRSASPFDAASVSS